MLKKLLSMLLALMLLCGCAALAETADYAGQWTLIGADMGGVPVDLSLINLTMTMDLREDGTCTLVTMGMPEEGVWSEIGSMVIVTDSQGDPLTFTLTNGKLEAVNGNMKIIFARLQDTASYVGVWELTGMIASGVEMGPETLALFGLSMTVTLNEDGTCVMDASGEVQSGVWTATANGVSIDDGIEAVEFAYADDMLTIEADGSVMMLTRSGSAPAAAQKAAAAPMSGVPAEAFEGKWELATATVFGMELTAEDLGTFMVFDLAQGVGTYTESAADGETIQVNVAYEVTETEGEATLLTVFAYDDRVGEYVEMLAMNMLDDGRLNCMMIVEELEIGYYFVPVTEEVPAE